MVQAKVISKELCAVAYAPSEILIRHRGRNFYGTEKTLAHIDNEGNLVIDEGVAHEFGIQVKMQ